MNKHITEPNSSTNTISVFTDPSTKNYLEIANIPVSSCCIEFDDRKRINLCIVQSMHTGVEYKGGENTLKLNTTKIALPYVESKSHPMPMHIDWLKVKCDECNKPFQWNLV